MESNSLRYIKGVGPKKEEAFKKLGIFSVKDLIYYFPFRYEDRSNVKKIKQLVEDETSVIVAKVSAVKLKKIPYFARKSRVRSVFEVLVDDSTALARCVWFNQEYLADYIKVGETLVVFGKVKKDTGKFTFLFPQYEKLAENGEGNVGKIVGVYRVTPTIGQRFIRKLITTCIKEYRNKLTDSLPFILRQKMSLPNIFESLEAMHNPSSWLQANLARQRFIFEELFFAQILVYLRKARHRSQKGVQLKVDQKVVEKIKNNLEFSLTAAQETAIEKIFHDMTMTFPMHRLLQGDVGCGKTIVAAFAIALAASCGYQVALMVPTEVLVYQHKQTLDRVFKGFNFKVEILISSFTKNKTEQIYQGLSNGEINIIIGTHALIQEEVTFKNLGLVVIDEQHKFGVGQRALLPKKGNLNPHCLIMSATPIPRSLALSLYGDLDLSVIKELPKTRVLAETIWVKEDKRDWTYNFIKEKLRQGRQAYIVYPLIEESEDEELLSLEEMYKDLEKIFSAYHLGMFHGKMKSNEKISVINKFRDKKIDLLVATTVVEVGVNIENASIMLVENPERFGLAQLHQLRGRIQRAHYQPYFILLSRDELTVQAKQRLKIISTVNDGFRIAEEDLALRGPGDFFGHFQHGFDDLRLANPLLDMEILQTARKDAYDIIKSDPYLDQKQHQCIRDHLGFWFSGKKKGIEQNAGK